MKTCPAPSWYGSAIKVTTYCTLRRSSLARRIPTGSTAQREGRIILTADKDFGDLVFRDRLTTHGVVLLGLGDTLLADRVARLEQAWASVEAHPIGKFNVITPSKVRIRNLLTDEAG